MLVCYPKHSGGHLGSLGVGKRRIAGLDLERQLLRDRSIGLVHGGAHGLGECLQLLDQGDSRQRARALLVDQALQASDSGRKCSS
jgi:hypothetical protein